MNLLTNRIIFKKTGLLLLVILFFLSCKREKNKVGVDDPARLPSDTHFTDTITVKSQVVLINDSINTTNVAGSNSNSFIMAGAYSDPLIGKTAVEAYTRLILATQYVELPAATVDSAYLYLSYSYYYGNVLQGQTLNVYALTDYISSDITYFSSSSAISHESTPIGTISFNTSTDSAAQLKITIDPAYAQSILNASKNNSGFQSEIKGLAIIPANNSSGAIIRIDGNSTGTALQIYYKQYGVGGNLYSILLDGNARKFYRVTADRSGKDLASLVNNYDSISTDALPSSSNRCYIQACTGIRTRLSFPYLMKLKEAYPNIAIIKGELAIAPSSGSDTSTYPPNSALLLYRTENNKIKKNTAGVVYYVQPDDYTQTGIASINIATLVNHQYAFPLRSYVQAVLLGKLPNDPIILSPALLSTDINRLVFDDNENSSQPFKLNLYFTTTK